ncbi:hypothetical protein Q4I32_003506 [Leishmania shawi]|uniref:Uncharacterized protein n=1 Tax=Leishmania shawi TaxID=5680 RepID=A0AAW3BXK4_9TRYP
MPSSLRKYVQRSPADMQSRTAVGGTAADPTMPPVTVKDGTSFAVASNPAQAPLTQERGGSSGAGAASGPSPYLLPSGSYGHPMGIFSPSVATVKNPCFALFRPSATPQANVATQSASTARGGGAGGSASGAPDNMVVPSMGSGLRKSIASPFGGSPNTRLRQPFGVGAAAQTLPLSLQQQQQGPTGTPPPLHRSSFDGTISPPSLSSAAVVTGGSGDGGGASSAGLPSTLTSAMSVSGLSNHLRLSEGLNCIDYHPSFRALAIGSTRQIHVVEVITIVGHDVADAMRLRRQRQQQQQQQPSANAVGSPDGERPHASLGSAAPPDLPVSPLPAPRSTPFLMRNTGAFGGLNKVESVVWYPSTEEASLAFIQPARTVTIFLDAIQFKADGTYLPQQWTRSQYKGKTLASTLAAGGGSTAMAVVASLDCISGGVTPAVSTTSLSGGSGLYTPASASLASPPSFSAVSVSHGSTPHEISLSTPTSAGLSTTGFPARNLPYVLRNPKGPLAKELIELNIDITYMRVEKIVWDPHHPYTIALTSPATHFEMWQVPTDGSRVYAPQLVLRPPAHNTRSVVRDIVFSPSNPYIIIVVTECGNTGQVLLYDRRQVEAKRSFDISGPGLSVAFHPLFSDLLAVCFRREKTKSDTRIAFLQVMSDSGTAAPTIADSATGEVGWLSRVPQAAAPAAPAASSGPERGPLTAPSPVPPAGTVTKSPDASFIPNMIPTSTSPYLVKQSHLLPIDNYACISRMQWRPSSMGKLTEPKQHHYLSFRPSAQELFVACNSPNLTIPSASGPFTWVDLLHSQLWFASAAMTTDTDLSIWDATNGFFPVCAVKHLSPHGDAKSSESNDFVWLNELTLVTIFKSGDVVCTSLLNTLLEDSFMTSAERVQLQTATPQQQQQLQQQRHQLDLNARDELGELYTRRIVEEEACLTMLPAYARDPYADLFSTFTVLPTTSIVSDLFGRSYTIRNTNVALQRYYHQMIRRECGQLVRRLAIQASKEAVLRQQWTKRRYQLPGPGPSTGPGKASGLATLQEQWSRRPHSPFMQSGVPLARATSPHGSDSTPPSPQSRMLTRRHPSVASPSLVGARHAPVVPNLGESMSAGRAGSREAGRGGGGGTVADALGFPQHPLSSLDDVSEVEMVLSQHAREPRRHATERKIADQLMKDAEVSRRVTSPCPEVANAEEEATAVIDDNDRSNSRTSSAASWIGRLLGFSWRDRLNHNRSNESRGQSVLCPPGLSQMEDAAVVTISDDDGPEALANVLDVTSNLSAVPSSDDVAAAALPPSRLRQLPPFAVGYGGATNCSSGLGLAPSTATSPISVIHVDNSDSSCGSPHQLAPTATAFHIRASAVHCFPAYPGASASTTAAVNSAFSPPQQRVGGGRGGLSPSSLPQASSSAGAPTSVLGGLDIIGGSSDVVFMQLFPLLNECVQVHSGSCKARWRCDGSEGWRLSPLSSSIPKRSTLLASAASPSTAPSSLDDSPTSPLLLPFPVPDSLGSRAAGGAVAPKRLANATSLLMSAHAYLESQRVVTAAVESFVLSDAVCGWSYSEMQAEQLAFVRFALEWDMGYELALAMKALRHKRSDAKAVAEALATAPHRKDSMTTAHACGPARSQVSSREPEERNDSIWNAPPRSWRSQQTMAREPHRPQPGGTSTGVAAGRERRHQGKGGTCGTPHRRLGALTADPTRMVDWGNGVPVPSHEDVDDKVAAMMEKNARICERMLRQRRETGGATSADSGAHADGRRPQGGGNSGVRVSGSVVQSSDDAATTRNGVEGGEVSHQATALSAELSNAVACDPRAQWWRAAAHAWRSHHVSFIISITTQQLEYAALMGDVQYSLVLYILFCLWWRLHSEVAEATYAMALEARASVHHVGSGVNRDGSAGERDRHRGVSSQECSPHSHAGSSHRLHVVAPSQGMAVKAEKGDGRGDVGASGTAVDTPLSTTAPPLRTASTDDDDRDDGAGRARIGFQLSSDATASEEDGYATDSKMPSLEKVNELRQLCLFFLQCPLMPLSPDLTPHHLHQQPHPNLRQSPSTGALFSVTGGGAEPGDRARNVSSLLARPPSTAILADGSGGQGLIDGLDMAGSLASGGFLRTSDSTHSLPPRSENNSSSRPNDTPTTLVMIGNSSATASYRGHVTPSMLQAPQWPDINSSENCADVGDGTTTSGTMLGACNAYVDLEGLRGVRLYSRKASDLCTTPYYCAPEEWKIRALQWLETYTADLYARQLYVPLNELLLVMPEIFREPTNPVLPRAADIAYEKQMTYVYCGTCSKTELWSRTQQDTIPAAVRLYDLIVRRGHHSSSSSSSEGDESDSDGGVNGATNARGAGARRSWRKSRGEHEDATAAIRCGSEEYYYRDGDDSSSVATTPSVESPTSSSLSGAADCDGSGARLADGTLTSPAGSDISLSSDQITNEPAGSDTNALHEMAPLEKALLSRELKLNGSNGGASGTGRSHPSTAAGPAAALLVPSSQCVAASASRPLLCGPHNRRVTRFRFHQSRRSLDDAANSSPDAEREGENADDGEESHLAGAALDLVHRPDRRTAVGCGKCDGNPTANNAACRSCHDRGAMTCVICEEIVEGMFFWLRSCGHGGHVHHIEEWLRYSQECPKCGVSITETWKGK